MHNKPMTICALLFYLSIYTINALDSFNQSECKNSKSCIRWSSCDFADCDLASSWKAVKYNATDYLQIELIAQFDSPNGYVSLGFSVDQTMNDNGLVTCSILNGTMDIIAGYNVKPKNYILPDSQLDKNFFVKFLGTTYGVEFDSASNTLRCRFLRLMKPVVNKDTLKDLTNEVYYLIYAKGAMNLNRLRYHGSNRRFSNEQFNFQSDKWVDLVVIYTNNVLIQLHACFMIIAWVFLATNGLMLAFFYKGNWPERKIFGNKIWFQLHRTIQLLCVAFTVAGFIFIFVKVKGYSRFSSLPNSAHPIMGIVTTSLMLTNVLMALFRCHPDHEKRWIFNWAHFIVGSSTYILAISTIAIGIQLPGVGKILHNLKYPWILVVVFLCLVFCLYIYAKLRMRKVSELSITNAPKIYVNTSMEEKEKKRTLSGLEVIAFSLIISVAFGIAFIVFVLIN